MIAFLSILTGPVGKILGIVALSLGLLAVGGRIVHEHDVRVLAQQQASEQAARIATLEADHARTVAALEEQATRAAAYQQALSTVRSTINAAPRTTACAASPAVRAALDGLRRPTPSGGGAAATDSAVAANVRTPAGRAGAGR